MFAFPDPLYPIADVRPGGDTVALATAILSAGARLLQLRAKDLPSGEFVDLAREIQARAVKAGAALIINDRADIAKLVGAAGVHLGQDDLPVSAARQLLGTTAIIGFSTHNRAQLDAAVHEGGMDYLAFGPLFETTSKRNPDPVQGLARLAEIRAACPLPLAAIGGIEARTLPDVLTAGADAVAVIGAIASAGDPAGRTGELLALARRLR